MKRVMMLLDNSMVSDARVEKEAKALVEKGFEVTILATHDHKLPNTESRNGFRIHRAIGTDFITPFGEKHKLFLKESVQTICSFEFDFLHCHDFYMLKIGALVKVVKPEIKLIYDAHEYLKGWPFYQTNKGIINKLKGYIVWRKLIMDEKKAMNNTDLVITITPSLSKKFKSDHKLEFDPIVIGNYPEKIKFKDENNLKTDLQIPSNLKIIVHSGSIYHSNKEINDLFQIIQQEKRLALVFIGNRPKYFELKDKVQNENWERIYFYPYPTNQIEIFGLLSQADIGLLHVQNKWEAHRLGFSNRFVEYINAGIPVVATPQEFTEQLNQKYSCCIFYRSDSKQSLKNAIYEMLNNHENKKKNTHLAQKDLNWETEAESLIKAYEAII